MPEATGMNEGRCIRNACYHYHQKPSTGVGGPNGWRRGVRQAVGARTKMSVLGIFVPADRGLMGEGILIEQRDLHTGR